MLRSRSSPGLFNSNNGYQFSFLPKVGVLGSGNYALGFVVFIRILHARKSAVLGCVGSLLWLELGLFNSNNGYQFSFVPKVGVLRSGNYALEFVVIIRIFHARKSAVSG